MANDTKLQGALRWLGMGSTGILCGLLLGSFAVGESLRPAERDFSFSQYSGNPDALTVDSHPVEPCYGCADSYGVAVRLNAAHIQRADDAFRQLGAVEVDQAPPDECYRYGGNFDDADDGPVMLPFAEETYEASATLGTPASLQC